jgi:Domain of unknown function (DUF4169)
MGDVANLRSARKRQARAKAEIEAAANRIAHGVSKKLKAEAAAERALASKRLEAHQRPERGDVD